MLSQPTPNQPTKQQNKTKQTKQNKINNLRLKQKIKITFNRIEWKPKILKNKPKQQKQ